MKNPKTRQPDAVSGTIAHEGVTKPMNNTMGTGAHASADLDTDKLSGDESSVAEALTDTHQIDPNQLTDNIKDSIK